MLSARISSQRLALKQSAAAPSVPKTLKVVCKASLKQESAKAALVSIPALLAASPAFALVDERLNGDGVGLPFGVNDGILGWVIFGVFSAVWTAWFISQKDLGDYEDPDAGLKI